MNLLNLRNLALTALLILVAGPVVGGQTMNFSGGPEDTRWALSGTVFSCRFEQPLPGYGRAVFYQRAGEDVQFSLEADRNLMANTMAQVSIAPAPWQPSVRSEPLGVARVVDGTPVLSLDFGRSNQFMHALREGRMPTISHQTYYDSDRFIQVQVSAVQFEKAFQDFLLCENQLLKVNFDQVARTKVHFKTGQEAVSLDDLRQIDQIIYYIKSDPRVTAVYLDGHTDNVGRRYDNRQISKRRVEAVERYFIDNEIDPEMITTRFHGGRYPVANNNTAKGRAENRRVTIRLEMDEDIPLPDNLVFQLPEDAFVAPTLSLPVSSR
ncbi:MAG: OmpA family protein [Thalassolituus sp.]